MPPQKTAAKSTPAQPPAPTTTEPARKAWVKRTPLEAFLETIGKQEKKVADMRADLAREERGLAKLLEAKKVLETV